MKPDSINIPSLMRKYGLFADKKLGQNFLIDETALEKIIRAADLNPNDLILEIGAGLGNLTRWLAVSAKNVIAIELDSRLLPGLNETVESLPNAQIIQGDILTINPETLISKFQNEKITQSYCVVANIPYYITSAVIRHLLEAEVKPEKIILTIQREVAERICATPGKMSLLSLSVQVYGEPKIISLIPAGAFYPKPNVDSSIIRIDIYPQPLIESQLLDTFFRLIKAGFSQKRKTIRNAFKAGLSQQVSDVDRLLKAAEIDPFRRAETLSISEWRNLCLKYN